MGFEVIVVIELPEGSAQLGGRGRGQPQSQSLSGELSTQQASCGHPGDLCCPGLGQRLVTVDPSTRRPPPSRPPGVLRVRCPAGCRLAVSTHTPRGAQSPVSMAKAQRQPATLWERRAHRRGWEQGRTGRDHGGLQRPAASKPCGLAVSPDLSGASASSRRRSRHPPGGAVKVHDEVPNAKQAGAATVLGGVRTAQRRPPGARGRSAPQRWALRPWPLGFPSGDRNHGEVYA